ncbi:M14 family metallopeptidase [Sulfurimonas sp. HSL3-7]|uniref:M14 family metallopeptidase n=1 Tax=Sulfonitrofixus jiaomeiensis TaxID=3131938 RepID=UPI0031F775E3
MRQQYISYQECVDFFLSAQASHPDLFKVTTIGKTWEERDMIAVTISKGMEDADSKPALFYTGSIHAREWIGIELAVKYAHHLLEHIEFDPQLNQLLERATFYVVPCANPDGFEYSRNHFSFWRKNRRHNADGTFGVDLNRNFSIGYAPSKNTSSNVYSGPQPFSEPETAALRDFVLAHPNITIALDYHSQGNVFFPAHNFIHEDAIDATDLNTLSANMAEEIRKVSGREYGVHMGKPPTHLISGSGREFYYSQGALALTVEVGSRNISDYQENMLEHINENIAALTYALSEVPNYDKTKSLPRVGNFIATSVGSRDVELSWDYPEDEKVYFEIYRSKKLKGYTQSSNRVGTTLSHSFVDRQLESATNYHYFIRAVCKVRHIKSAFAPVLGVRTDPETTMFSKILYPLRSEIGYVGEKTTKNKEHFGENSLFVGISEYKGECYGISSFSLESVPENALIKSAQISYYPMNRVSVHVEKFGEWRVGLVDERTIDNLASFDEVKNAKVLGYIGMATKSSQLSQGVWRTYRFNKQERNVLQDALKRRKAVFRMEGPTKLPIDRASQMMQWDIGYGPHSGGLTFRPKLEVTYTLQEAKLELYSQQEYTITEQEVKESSLVAGFDQNGSRIYGCIEFDMTQILDMQNTIVSDAYLELDARQINANASIRYHIEMVKMGDGEKSFKKMREREVIERVGYEVSVADLRQDKAQRFVFDTLSIQEMVDTIQANEKILFVIKASSSKSFAKSESVNWLDAKRECRPRLILDYIKKRRYGIEKATNLRASVENGMIRLDWDNPVDEAFKGVIVVKNPFHVPSSAYDGQKLYGGPDNYTYDNFGDLDVGKYYAVFAYDEVPHISEPAVLAYNIEN